jgi:hypothetical protein
MEREYNEEEEIKVKFRRIKDRKEGEDSKKEKKENKKRRDQL